MQPNINERFVYEELFQIFEQDFRDIAQYVAIADTNLNVYSNKIHELHLRICNEVENVLKLVIHNYFIEESEIKALWDTQKSSFLKKGKEDLITDYQSLKNKLNRKGGEELDKGLFGFPDFQFYYKLACEKFNLHLKYVRFKKSIAGIFTFKNFSPFYEKKQIPVWWSNYNGIKHNKIRNYEECTLKDLIYSFGALYILMNYLSRYKKNNLPVVDESSLQEFPKENLLENENWFQSNIFSPSFCLSASIFPAIISKKILNEDEYIKELPKIESAKNAKIENNNTFNPNLKYYQRPCSIYFSYFDYKRYIVGDLLENGIPNSHWRLIKYWVFVN